MLREENHNGKSHTNESMEILIENVQVTIFVIDVMDIEYNRTTMNWIEKK